MYKKAIFDLVEFDVEDVITTSNGAASSPTIPDQPSRDYPIDDDEGAGFPSED